MSAATKNDLKPSGKIVIAGGTGLIGRHTAQQLHEAGCEVIVLTRSAGAKADPWQHATWDGRTVGDWAAHLEGASAVVNLAGRTVDCIKTPDHCDEILRSRVGATTTLGAALSEVQSPPPVWVQMSTAHIHGDPPEVVCDEESAIGLGLAPDVGRAWEQAYADSVPQGMRQVITRTSFVIGKNGGAFPALKRLARLGNRLRAVLGSNHPIAGRTQIELHQLDGVRLVVDYQEFAPS